jgi:hypothetical protein
MIKSVFILFFLTIFIFSNSKDNHKYSKIQVTVLGTYHFSNPPQIAGFDLGNSDIKSPQRQKELERVLIELENYNPTKILIEKQIGEEIWNDQYEKYLNHQNPDSLGKNEIYQIGFRLAGRLGHKKLYPFDYKVKLNYSPLMELLKEDTLFSNNIDKVQMEIMNTAIGLFSKLDTVSLSEIFRVMNSEYYVENIDNKYYMEVLKLGKDSNYAGVDLYLSWLERNLKMFHNITRITDFNNKDERLLIIVGSAHTKYLKDLIEDSQYFEYIDIVNIL